MKQVTRLISTGDQLIDSVLQAIISRFEMSFPGRIGRFYIEGSHADGTSWAATALVALQAGRYVTSKRECHSIYQATIKDEWSPLLADIYNLCRGTWRYLIPEAPEDLQRLRAICERTLAFENHFLSIYWAWLSSQRDSARMEPAT